VPQTFWDFDEVGHTQDAKKEVVALFGIDVFGTPKPERLIQRILHIATNPGDLVLDSFLGSGTTAAVAHKMGRRWIGIEMGDHAVTHCAPRLAKVIGGEQGGISQAVGWQGGGGFTFYRLGEPVFDADGKVTAGIGYASLAAHVWFSEVGLPLPEGGTARSGASSFVTPDLIRGPASFPAGETEEAGSRLGGRDDEEGEGPLHPSPAADRAPPRAGEDFSPPFLGVHDGRGYALLYNGVLGDRRPDGGNVLTTATLATIRAAGAGFAGPITVYGEATRLGAARLLAEGVTFKQTPYDVRAR
jgi:adenine-specific DNA-methyltransferase